MSKFFSALFVSVFSLAISSPVLAADKVVVIPLFSKGNNTTSGMAIGGSITSATAGSILFAGTSGVLAQDNNR